MPIPLLRFWVCFCLLCLATRSLAADKIPVWVTTPEEAKSLWLQPLDLGDGQFFMPRHDGKTYFIDPSDAPVVEGEKPSAADIERVAATAKKVDIASNTSIGGTFLSRSLASLPLTLKIANGDGMKENEKVFYEVTLMSMVFKPSGLVLTIGMKFLMPGQYEGKDQYIYLGAKNLLIPYQGGTLSGDLLLIETGALLKNVYLGDKVFFDLGPATALRFNCGELKGFHLNGKVTLPQDMLAPEDAKGNLQPGRVAFLLDVDVAHWDNLYIGLTFAGGFRLPAGTSAGSEPPLITDVTHIEQVV